MGNDFAVLLRECRKEAQLKQKELGQLIHHADGSMISRFEKGTSTPNPSTLQEIINVLSLREGVSQDKLDRFWEATGFPHKPIISTVPIVEFIQHAYEGLDNEEKKGLLSADLQNFVALELGFFTAQDNNEQHKWSQAKDQLGLLRPQIDEWNQLWSLRIESEQGRCNYCLGNLADANNNYDSALWNAVQLDDDPMQGEILIKMGDVCRRLGGNNWETAHSHYSRAVEIFKKLQHQERVADCIRKRAATYLFAGRPDKSEPLCEVSMTICRKVGYTIGLYKGLQHLAWVYEMTGNWRTATELCEEALDLVSDDWDRIKALRYLGDAYRIARRPEAARKAYEEALQVFEQFHKKGVRSSRTIGLIHLGLAKLFLKQSEQTLDAQRHLNEGLRFHGGLGADYRAIDFAAEKGFLLLRLGRFQEAEQSLKLANNWFKEVGNVFYYANSLAMLCELYYEKAKKLENGEKQVCFDLIDDAAVSIKEEDNGLIDYFLVRIEFIVGKVRVWEGEFSTASNIWGRSLERALNFNRIVFDETFEKVSNEINRVTRAIGYRQAILLCQKLEDFWKDNDPGSHREAVEKSLVIIRRQREEAEALLSVGE